MDIIIFDGSFQTTPFINRLANGLSEKHSVYILGFNENVTGRLRNIHYISLGSNQNKLSFLLTTLQYAFKRPNLSYFIKTLKLLLKGNKQALQKQNFRWVLEKLKPDIVHLQWPAVIPWVEEILISKKFPVLMSQRGFHSNVRPFVDSNNFEYLKKWYPKMAGVHSVSKAVSRNGDKIWNSHHKIDKVVYTGIPIMEIPFSKAYIYSKPLKILSIGRAHWKKGYEYALQSCALLQERGISFEYTIIGAKDNEELQFMVDDLALKDSVFLKGKISQSEVFQLMSASSILLLPSLEEGIANVVVEAMAIGLPVISTDCGGMEEVVKNNKNGWTVPSRNPEAMAEALIYFINKPNEEVEKIRLEARRKIEAQHDLDTMIAEMEKLYSSVILNFK